MRYCLLLQQQWFFQNIEKARSVQFAQLLHDFVKNLSFQIITEVFRDFIQSQRIIFRDFTQSLRIFSEFIKSLRIFFRDFIKSLRIFRDFIQSLRIFRDFIKSLRIFREFIKSLRIFRVYLSKSLEFQELYILPRDFIKTLETIYSPQDFYKVPGFQIVPTTSARHYSISTNIIISFESVHFYVKMNPILYFRT